jgi:uncharacterized membrane protein YeaQ/YmgE (transglycosylase-associated protein family)
MAHPSVVFAALPSLESILIALLIGLVAGFLAGKLVGGGSFGLIRNIIVGLLGAVIGDFLVGLLNISFIPSIPLLNSLIIAFLGACVLLLVLRFVTGSGKRR